MDKNKLIKYGAIALISIALVVLGANVGDVLGVALGDDGLIAVCQQLVDATNQ